MGRGKENTRPCISAGRVSKKGRTCAGEFGAGLNEIIHLMRRLIYRLSRGIM